MKIVQNGLLSWVEANSTIFELECRLDTASTYSGTEQPLQFPNGSSRYFESW
jgi:hypothetical protein